MSLELRNFSRCRSGAPFDQTSHRSGWLRVDRLSMLGIHCVRVKYQRSRLKTVLNISEISKHKLRFA